MRRVLSISALAGLALVAQVNDVLRAPDPAEEAARYRNLIIALGSDGRALRPVPDLRINTDKTVRLIVADKCEQQGERELQRLAVASDVEESYLFLPALCLWIEVGSEERRDGTHLDAAMIAAVALQFDLLKVYHIHADEPANVRNYLPAYKDLISLVLINTARILEPRADIRHRIVTRLGVVEYAFADKVHVRALVRKYRKAGLAGYEAQNLAYEFLRPQYRDDYFRRAARCDGTAGSVGDMLRSCLPIHTRAFAVTFRPITPRTARTGTAPQ